MRILNIIVLFCFLMLPLGCYSWQPYGNVVFKKTTPYGFPGRAPITVGMVVFKDMRNSKEKKRTYSIRDIDQEITFVFAKQLESSGLFSEIKLPYRPGDVDLILTGEIKHFTWKGTDMSPAYVQPIITSLFLLFGPPLMRITAHASITVSIINPYTGATIATYNDDQKISTSAGLYSSIKIGRIQKSLKIPGNELNTLFLTMCDNINRRIFLDRHRLVSQVYRYQ